MTRILLSGYSGKMGKNVINCAANFSDVQIVAGVDKFPTQVPFPTFTSFIDINVDFDVIVDFSNTSVLDSLLDFITAKNKPAVISTTGFTPEQTEKIKEYAKKTPIFFSANMSLGVSLMAQLSAMAAKVLGETYDIEIVEMHHNQKIDSPSGTALMLADEISDALNTCPRYEYDRHSKRVKRDKNEIGISSVRCGTIVGEHEVIFAGTDEVIKISHSAYSKALFANGAINAARFINGKGPKLYNMKDLINS